ncbi:MAG: hypothetical protein RR842_10380 [Gordonibacter sp.]|uniref:hypothetical protein n=1 Tax=Gordonibacter sp. TaxID=1968902 RepID=UPI002FC8648B
MGIDFDGLDAIVTKLERLGVGTGKVAEAALKVSHEIVTGQVDKAQSASAYNIAPGVTGATASAVSRVFSIEWEGTCASVGVGWSIRAGGLPSVFLMYGTPTLAPDRSLYNAIYGGKTKQLVQQAQADTLLDFLIDGSVR